MKRYLLLIVIIVISIACNKKENLTSDAADTTFDAFKDEFLLQLWERSPGWASWAGLHEYDSILPINSLENRQQELKWIDSLRTALNKIDPESLSDANRTDLYMINNFLDSNEWYTSEFRSFEWNPSSNNVAGRVWTIINGDYADLNDRMTILSAYLKNVPDYYAVGFKQLKTPTKEHLKLGILQNKGGLELFGQSLQDSVASSGLPKEQKELLLERVSNAKQAIANYVSQLEQLDQELTDEKARSSRIGKELFFKKYTLDINADYTAEEIYTIALEEKARLHKQMIEISDTIWNNYLPETQKPSEPLKMVKMLIDKIAEKHVAREDFFQEIERQIPLLAAFVEEKDLLTQDPEKPLVVRETPKYMRGGGAGASISNPGPYESDRDTYYNVTPLDNYSDEEAESYLREYNHYILQILNIHEAIPGHYTQLVYGNKSPSVIKSLFGNGAMIEGWANYAEIMMLEEGYNASPEMWLMRNKWHLRGVTNTLLDYSYHVLGISKEEAMKLMVDDAFQEETEAQNKWRRVTLSSVQLSSYFTGFTQIYNLREELKETQGVDFNLKEFHEEFLSYGNAPVRHIRELMMAEETLETP